MKFSTILKMVVVLSLLVATAVITYRFTASASGSGKNAEVAELQRQVEGLRKELEVVLSSKSDRTREGASSDDAGATSGSDLKSAITPIPGNTKGNLAQTKKLGAVLDVWLFDGKSFEIPSTPSDYTLIDRSKPFRLARFLDEPDLQSYKGKAVGLLWQGRIHIDTAGRHVVILDYRVGDVDALGNWGVAGPPRFSSFSIKNEVVFSGDLNKAEEWRRNTAHPLTAIVDLEPGDYDFKFWITPKSLLQSYLHYDYSTLTMTLKLKGPGDLTPIEVGADRLFHIE